MNVIDKLGRIRKEAVRTQVKDAPHLTYAGLEVLTAIEALSYKPESRGLESR
jgi:hypothetical protein